MALVLPRTERELTRGRGPLIGSASGVGLCCGGHSRPQDKQRLAHDQGLGGRIEIRNAHNWDVRSDRDGHLVFRQGPFRLATAAVLADLWQHVALVWDGANLTWWIDGQRDTSAAAPPPTGGGPIEIKGHKSAIDELALYPAALDAERLTAHARHRNTHTGTLSGAHSYWPGSDQPGGTIADRNGANHGQGTGDPRFGLPGPLPGTKAIGINTGDTLTLPVPAGPTATYQWWTRPEGTIGAEQVLALLGDLQVTARPDGRIQITDPQHHTPRLLTRGRLEADRWALIGLVVDHDKVTLYLNGRHDTTARLSAGTPDRLVLQGGTTGIAISTAACWATPLGPEAMVGLWALR